MKCLVNAIGEPLQGSHLADEWKSTEEILKALRLKLGESLVKGMPALTDIPKYITFQNILRNLFQNCSLILHMKFSL